jgi:hypothetical protein
MDKVKNQVLQELIDLMESKMTEGLKSKSPKFMKVETNSPELAEEVVESVLENESSQEMPDSEEMSEMPSEESSLPMESESLEEPSKASDFRRMMQLKKR